jgi:hypothetical protein
MDKIDKEKLRNEILRLLYSAFSAGRRMVGISEISESLKVNENEVIKLLDELNRPKNWACVTNDSYRILPDGIIYSEQKELASTSIIERNDEIRAEVLEETAKVYHASGPLNGIFIEDFANKTNIDVYILLNNIEFLETMGFLTSHLKLGDVQITESGLLAVEVLHFRSELSEDFKKISGMEPHRRGKELEHLIAKLADFEGWKVDESVRTSNEEIDIAIYQDQKFFLIECKWEKNPIETQAIGSFYSKLSKRDGVKGIFVSMSGFTKGAKEEVLIHMGDRIILLFGLSDVEKIIDHNVELETIIDEKLSRLITKREILLG